MKAKSNIDEITPEDEAIMTVLSNIIIDDYLSKTPEERKAFVKKCDDLEKIRLQRLLLNLLEYHWRIKSIIL